MNDKKLIQEKVAALLARMTLEEKVAQMVQVPYSTVGREEALKWARLGAGSFLHALGDEAREVQRVAMTETRLGIPVIFGIDAIHGHGLNEHATIFPTQLTLACSWDAALAEEMGRITAREVATDGLHWTFSPVLCLGRDTRWGRVDETFGEDPYLAGELGEGIIRGYQGDDLAGPESILACAKHYIAYGEATGGRDSYDTEITYRKMREVLLHPFRKAVEAGCATLMTAYGSIDGTPLTTDSYMLRDVLRKELGFDGFLVTDWHNVYNLMRFQHVAADMPEACTLAAKGGNDMIMTTVEFYENALAAVKKGLLPESLIDEAVTHILTVKFRMELFDRPEKMGRPGCLGCQEHLDASLAAARRTVTLLRNDGVLPLREHVRSVAVIGPNADDALAQYGDWTYFTHPDFPDSARPGVRPYVTVREGVEACCQERNVRCLYHKGCSVKHSAQDDIPGAVETAAQADAVVLVLGDEISQIGESKDRADLTLSGRQMELYRAVRATGKPVIVVWVASKPLCLGEAAEANAFVCAFNGGMFAGQAVAEVLFGEVEPSGRLPISFPKHVGQLPIYYSQLPGWHGWYGDAYCDMDNKPVFSFGEGMGYTTFAYSGLTMDAATLTAQVEVTNTGDRTGLETVQVYFRDVVSSVMTPVKRLIAYQQAHLQPGETRRLTFRLKREDFALVNRQEQTVVEPGEFILFVGHSAKDEDLLQVSFCLD